MARTSNGGGPAGPPLVKVDDYGITIYPGNIRRWLADHPPRVFLRTGQLGCLTGRFIGAAFRWAL